MSTAWAPALLLCLVACAEVPAPAGRLARLEAPATPEEARQAGCDLAGPNDGAGIFTLTASIAPEATVLIQAIGLSSGESIPIQLLMGLGRVSSEAEPIFDSLLLDEPAEIDARDHYLDLRVGALPLWPLALDEGEPVRPSLVLGRFVVELYAEEEGLYASGAILSGYLIGALFAGPDARVEGDPATSCAGPSCNATAVCVRADIDPLTPRSE